MARQAIAIASRKPVVPTRARAQAEPPMRRSEAPDATTLRHADAHLDLWLRAIANILPIELG
jgi:hypothetical protein